jgi:response regulator NasT
MDPGLKIVIVDASPLRAAILEEGLREVGHRNVVHIADRTNLLARITTLDPDVILIDLEDPSRDVLEQMFQMSRIVKRPVALFVDQSDTASIEAAMDAGVSAYVVDGLKKERIKHILDMSISRFRVYSRLQEELERAKTALEERKVIDRAKGRASLTGSIHADSGCVGMSAVRTFLGRPRRLRSGLGTSGASSLSSERYKIRRRRPIETLSSVPDFINPQSVVKPMPDNSRASRTESVMGGCFM